MTTNKLAVACVLTILSSTLLSRIDAIKTTSDSQQYTKCEREMMETSEFSNNLWVQQMFRFYSKPQNVDKPFEVTFYVRCNGEKINRLDPQCRRSSRMLFDASMDWFRHIRRYVPIRIRVVDSSNDPTASWMSRKYGVDVDFPDSDRTHFDYGLTNKCPFGNKTLAHASSILLHVNMLQRFTLSDKPVPRHENLYTVLLHEVGHVFGLSHRQDRSSVMFPFSRVDEPNTPSPKDYKALDNLYADVVNQRMRFVRKNNDNDNNDNGNNDNNNNNNNNDRSDRDDEALVRRAVRLALQTLQRALYDAYVKL